MSSVASASNAIVPSRPHLPAVHGHSEPDDGPQASSFAMLLDSANVADTPAPPPHGERAERRSRADRSDHGAPARDRSADAGAPVQDGADSKDTKDCNECEDAKGSIEANGSGDAEKPKEAKEAEIATLGKATIEAKTADTTTDETADAGRDNTADITADVTADITTGKTVDTTADETTDTTADKTTDATAGKTADTITGMTADTTTGITADTTADKCADTTTDTTTDKTADKSANKSVDKTTAKTADTDADADDQTEDPAATPIPAPCDAAQTVTAINADAAPVVPPAGVAADEAPEAETLTALQPIGRHIATDGHNKAGEAQDAQPKDAAPHDTSSVPPVDAGNDGNAHGKGEKTSHKFHLAAGNLVAKPAIDAPAQGQGENTGAMKTGSEAGQNLGAWATTTQANSAAGPAAGAANGPAPAQAIAVPLAGLAVEIATQAQAGRHRFEIRLDPPELGRIDVRLDIDRDGNVTSRLVADRVETLDLLKRDAAELQRALQQAGLKTSDHALEFSLRQQGFARDEAGPQNVTPLVVPEDDPAPLEAMRQGYGRLLGLGGGLDIRV